MKKSYFLKTVKTHKMHILKDDGVYRHIRFKKPDSSDRYFDLVTWPGHLSFSGDMGCYVFSRLEDMFKFFETKDNKLAINTGYWTQKLQAISKFGSSDSEIESFSGKKTWECLSANVLKEYKLTKVARAELKERLLDCSDCHEAIRIMEEYEIVDAWHYLSYEYTYHMLWALYAIKWGILKYHKKKGIKNRRK